jgi:hypothetical protein
MRLKEEIYEVLSVHEYKTPMQIYNEIEEGKIGKENCKSAHYSSKINFNLYAMEQVGEIERRTK